MLSSVSDRSDKMVMYVELRALDGVLKEVVKVVIGGRKGSKLRTWMLQFCCIQGCLCSAGCSLLKRSCNEKVVKPK